MKTGTVFCILISLFITVACVHKPDTFSMDIYHNKEKIYFEQSVFSKGSYNYKMGDPQYRNQNQTFKFSFELDDISTLYYAYLSIETWDVEFGLSHPILLNGKKIGYLKSSVMGESQDKGNSYIPKNLEATQMYLPKRFFRQGQNLLKIKWVVPPNDPRRDSFAIQRLDIVVVKVKNDLNFGKVRPVDKAEKRYFPKQLRFFSELTDEELYISTVQLPQLFTELNLGYGVYRKKLSFIYSKIGDYHRWKGDYAKNLYYQKKAIKTELKEGHTSLIPYLMANLGLAQYYIGDYNISIATHKQALIELKKVNQSQLKKISPWRHEDIDSLQELINAHIALDYYQLEKYELAVQYCRNDVHYRLPLAIAIRAQVLGNINTKRNNFGLAADNYHTAIYYLNQNPQIYHDNILNNKLYLANTFYLQDNYKKAVEVLNDTANPTHEFKWRSQLLMGNIKLAENRLEEAIEQFAQSIEEIEFARAKLNYHGFKVTFMNDKQVPYQKIIASFEKIGDSTKAFNYAERAKARAFVDMIAKSKYLFYLKNAQLQELSAEEKHLRERLIDLQNRLDSEQKMFKERGANEKTNIDIKNASSALSHFYQTKAIQDENFASLSTVDTLTMQEIIELIPDDLTLIEYYYDSKSVYIWVVDNKQHHFIKKDIPILNLEDLIREYRDFIFKGKDIRGIKIVKTDEQDLFDFKTKFKRVSEDLKLILLDGVVDHIKTNKVYVVPHGAIHYLPFQSLRYNSHFLIEKYQIGYLPSATALKYVFAKRKEKPIKLLALGNPQFNTPQMQLPFAEKEVQHLKAIYPNAKIYIREDASETNFKKFAGGHDIIHVASHGEFNPNAPLLSCLRLSAGNGEDGRVETREIFSLNLDAYLVTLSACNTAIGKLTKGDEVVGLTRAFIFAGTPSILGTIWSVNDESTGIFMNHFYGKLKYMDKLKSLQEAQITMIRSDKYYHPYHWAGFQLIGDYY
jgi:CHAT domain-containing protein